MQPQSGAIEFKERLGGLSFLFVIFISRIGIFALGHHTIAKEAPKLGGLFFNPKY